MRERALVVKAAGKIAVLQIEKKPECDSCKACAFRAGKSRVKVKALNTAGANAGDEVIVVAEKDHRALASFIVYIVPVFLAGAGVLIGALCLKEELWAALLCIAGLLLGFAAVFLLDKIFSGSRGFGMEVIEICNKQNNDSEEENQNGTEN